MKRARGERIDGVLLLDKPGGMTSNHALQSARRLIGAAKAGHTGTLDPMATGLLPLTFGEATKFASDLLDASKSYRATMRLGVRTTTGDADGDVVERTIVQVDAAKLERVVRGFVGVIEQVPPMYSALKKDGRPLYKWARAGVEVERAVRKVTIDGLTIITVEDNDVVFDVDCSKGTYVRVLVEDIGRELGCGAHLAALRRTRVGELTLDGSVKLDELAVMPAVVRREWLQPVDALLSKLPTLTLDEPTGRRFRQGQRLALEAEPRDQRVRVYGCANELLGTATISPWGVVEPERVLSNEKNCEKELS